MAVARTPTRWTVTTACAWTTAINGNGQQHFFQGDIRDDPFVSLTIFFVYAAGHYHTGATVLPVRPWPPRRAASAVCPLVVQILRELGWGHDVLLSATATGTAAWPEAKRGMTSASVA